MSTPLQRWRLSAGSSLVSSPAQSPQRSASLSSPRFSTGRGPSPLSISTRQPAAATAVAPTCETGGTAAPATSASANRRPGQRQQHQAQQALQLEKPAAQHSSARTTEAGDTKVNDSAAVSSSAPPRASPRRRPIPARPKSHSPSAVAPRDHSEANVSPTAAAAAATTAAGGDTAAKASTTSPKVHQRQMRETAAAGRSSGKAEGSPAAATVAGGGGGHTTEEIRYAISEGGGSDDNGVSTCSKNTHQVYQPRAPGRPGAGQAQPESSAFLYSTRVPHTQRQQQTSPQNAEVNAQEEDVTASAGVPSPLPAQLLTFPERSTPSLSSIDQRADLSPPARARPSNNNNNSNHNNVATSREVAQASRRPGGGGGGDSAPQTTGTRQRTPLRPSVSAADTSAGSLGGRSGGSALSVLDEEARARQEAARARVRRAFASECEQRIGRETARVRELTQENLALRRRLLLLETTTGTAATTTSVGAAETAEATGEAQAEVRRLRAQLAEERAARVREALALNREINRQKLMVAQLRRALAAGGTEQ